MKETILDRFIKEATNKAESHNLDFEHKMVINGMEYPNIASFSLITLPTNDKNIIDDFTRKLTDSITKVVTMQDMHSKGELTCCFFNEKLEFMARIAGSLDQQDLFFCHTSEKGLVCEFWKKEQLEKPYDKVLNPYLLVSETTLWELEYNDSNVLTAIGDNFRYAVDISAFDRVNEKLESGIERVIKKYDRLKPTDVLPLAFNKVGQFPAICKKILIG